MTSDLPIATHQSGGGPGYPSLHQFRAESQRMRLEFLKHSIDISLTAVDLALRRPESDALRRRFHHTAQKGYQTVLAVLSRTRFPEGDIAGLRTRLQRLHQGLGTLSGAGEPKDEAAVHPTLATPNGSGGLNGEIAARQAGREQSPRQHAQFCTTEALTPREMQVLLAIVKGHSTKSLAYELGISFKTAACHRYRIMDKLAIHDVASLVRFAIRAGLIEP